MPNYQDGYIYKLWSLQTEEIYIGSSTTETRKRLYEHKSRYKGFLKGTHKTNYSVFEIVQYPDCKIEIIEKYPCNSRAELCKREGEHQRATKCCNVRMAGRTKKEYYENNIEKVKKYDKERYKNNIEEILKQKKEYYQKNKPKLNLQKKEYRQKKKKEKEKSNIEFLKIKIIKKG